MDQETQKILQGVKESQDSSQRVLEMIEKTLSGLRETISGIQETNQKFDKIKEDYNEVMDKFALKIANSFADAKEDPNFVPNVISMEKAVDSMMKHENILFITGAGVSVDSGISTFRGPNGLYSKNFIFEGKEYNPEEFIRKGFFDEHPEPIWEWIETLTKSVSQSTANENHHLIHQCLLALKNKKKKPVLVTQNIDDYHTKPTEDEYEYFPVHGVANQMRCEELHFQTFDILKVKEVCPICEGTLRPHVMFFDESYGHAFGKDIKDREFDFAVVIGTSLNTGLCYQLSRMAKETIEINPNPVIRYGDSHPFTINTTEALKSMLKAIESHK